MLSDEGGRKRTKEKKSDRNVLKENLNWNRRARKVLIQQKTNHNFQIIVSFEISSEIPT